MEMNTTVMKSGGSSNELIDRLKDEAIRNKTFNAVAHIFAIRERARQQVSVVALAAAMKKQGFEFSRNEYEHVLKFMGSLGLGTLDKDSRGRVRALKGIKLTLQSIGLAAVGEKKELTKYSPAAKFSKIPGVPQTILDKPPTTPKPTASKSVCKVTFTVTVDDKTVVFDIPEGVPKEDLGQFIASLYPRKAR